MQAAVFWRNIAISGTSSTAMTAAARRRANSCLSSNAPPGAYTSIIGIVLLPSHAQQEPLPEQEYRSVAVGGHSPEKVTLETRRRLTQMDDGAPAEAMPCWVTNHEAASPAQ